MKCAWGLVGQRAAARAGAAWILAVGTPAPAPVDPATNRPATSMATATVDVQRVGGVIERRCMSLPLRAASYGTAGAEVRRFVCLAHPLQLADAPPGSRRRCPEHPPVHVTVTQGDLSRVRVVLIRADARSGWFGVGSAGRNPEAVPILVRSIDAS